MFSRNNIFLKEQTDSQENWRYFLNVTLY